MRSLFIAFTAIFLALFSCERIDQDIAEICGIIRNPAASFISIKYYNDPIEFEYLTKTSELDANNKFILTLYISGLLGVALVEVL